MKTLFAFLFLVVSVSLAVEGLSGIPSAKPDDRNVVDGPTFCCFDFVTKRLPLRMLRSFEYTNDSCSMEGVVFITKKGLSICADPLRQWVQDYIRALTPA